jgi:hypothetical protein
VYVIALKCNKDVKYQSLFATQEHKRFSRHASLHWEENKCDLAQTTIKRVIRRPLGKTPMLLMGGKSSSFTETRQEEYMLKFSPKLATFRHIQP